MMHDVEFKVKAGDFEGPLELLLELIEKRKMHVSDVLLSDVADEYISHINRFENFPKKEVAHFLVVASTLLLIKSQSLLPGIELTPEETADVAELERRLEVYKRIRRLSGTIGKTIGTRRQFFKEPSADETVVFTPDPAVTVSSLKETALRIINAFPKPQALSRAVVEKVMSLEEMIEQLSERIQNAVSMRFSDFVKSSKGSEANAREEKLTVIVGFLALLELVRQGLLTAAQSGMFDEIEMGTGGDISVPDYR